MEELGQHEVINLLNSSREQKDIIKHQINKLESTYVGGLKEYSSRAKKLLLDSKNDVNQFEEYTLSIPEGIKIEIGNPDYLNFENQGMQQMSKVGFVLAGGGLGERLGYDGIKIGIPTDLITLRTFFSIYIDYIKAFESFIRKEKNNDIDENWYIPICIMTCDNTYLRTIEMLQQNNYFDMKKNQISIIKQENVLALKDFNCNFALKDHPHLLGIKLIDTKPHGHGDVHDLLFSNGIISDWLNKGKEHIIFFQDTNALAFNSIPSALGVSIKEKYAINYITIPRLAGEALGAICKLVSLKNNYSMTVNVEYNQLNSLLREKYSSKGDQPNEIGFSDFPGNTNILIFEIKTYSNAMQTSKGLYPEFVNPKYEDDSKSVFKSSTRLECMMQDFPKLFTNNEKVGFTMFDRWFCFSTCKNNLKDAIGKYKMGATPEAAFSLERDIYLCNLKKLQLMNKVQIIETYGKESFYIDNKFSNKVSIMGVEIEYPPKIIILPSFAATISQLNKKIKELISITINSTLILNGEDLFIKSLYLDGVLDTRSFQINLSGQSIKDINDNCILKNEDKIIKIINNYGHLFIPICEGEGKAYENLRGYRCELLKLN